MAKRKVVRKVPMRLGAYHDQRNLKYSKDPAILGDHVKYDDGSEERIERKSASKAVPHNPVAPETVNLTETQVTEEVTENVDVVVNDEETVSAPVVVEGDNDEDNSGE